MDKTIRTITYKKDDLNITVKSHGEPSLEAIENFNRIFHNTFDSIDKRKNIENKA